MMRSTATRSLSYRDRARPTIAKLVREIGLKDRPALVKALRAAYPFGKRRGWPYKAWLAEIRDQIGGIRPKKEDPNQLRLFD